MSARHSAAAVFSSGRDPRPGGAPGAGRLAAVVLAALMVGLPGCGDTGAAAKQLNAQWLAERGLVVERLNVRAEDGSGETAEVLLCGVNAHGGHVLYVLSGNYIDDSEVEATPSRGHVEELRASPDGRHLAIVYVGEGHPVLDVVDLPRLVRQRRYEARLTLDPYPGWIAVRRWDGSHLVVASDVLLTQRGADGRVPAALTLDPPEEFAVDAETGELTAARGELSDPVGYYISRLLSKDREAMLGAIDAFWVLGGKSVVPRLQERFRSEHDRGIRAVLLDAIEELRHRAWVEKQGEAAEQGTAEP